jgi:hypothetical protein
MILCLCVDKKNGMMFFGKRQSQDRIQREEMLKLIGNNRLWVSKYSASLFDETDNIVVDDDFYIKAEENDYCFVEDKNIDLNECSSVVIYNWNRHYPADKFFELDLKKYGYKLVLKRDFAGSSHEKITEEIYEKKVK